MRLRTTTLATAAALLLAVTAGCESAERSEGQADFPTRNITLQIPFPAGGPTDTEARIVASHAEDILGVSMIAENVEGAGGTVAWDRVPDFSTDGYEITLYNLPHIVSNPIVRDVRFDVDSFEWIAHIGRDPNAVIVRDDSEFETLDDLVEAAEADPGGVTVGMAGLWLAHHFTALGLQDQADIDLREQPFDGTAPAMQALMGGHVDVVISNVSDVVRTGEDVRAIGVAGEERSEFLPDTPTFIEQGFDWVLSSDRGIAAPAGTDEAALEVLREAFGEALESEELQQEFEAQGAAMHVLTDPDEIDAYVAEVEEIVRGILADIDHEAVDEALEGEELDEEDLEELDED